MFRTSARSLSPVRIRRALPLAALATAAVLLGSPVPAQAHEVRASTAPVAVAAPVPRGDAVAATAASFAGTPYRYGGTTPAGFDCSGFVGYVLAGHGVALPRTAAQMRAAVPRVAAADAVAGDLVFVHRGRRVSHVAVLAADGRWWEATRPGRRLGLHQAWTTSVSYGRP